MMHVAPHPPTHSPQLVSDDLRTKSQSILRQFVEKFGGIGVRGAVISTADGFDIAIATMSEEEGTKLSALSSSISAIGDMAATEMGTGSFHKSITIESDEGYVFIMSIPHTVCPMILSIIASKEALLGKLMFYANKVLEEMAEI